MTGVIVIGAGPAGLTAAYMLTKANIKVTVLEADPQHVGGSARTEVYKDYCFDVGGHRFYSKAREIEDFWTEVLPHDMLQRPRTSRIYYKGNFFAYPLNVAEVFQKLGLLEAATCFMSYLKARILKINSPITFTDWVCNHFGKRMFNMFFKTYTEKVWGVTCEEIPADWAAQRIKKSSLWSAMLAALSPNRKSRVRRKAIKTSMDTFRYPRKGPGMLWDACAAKIRARGGKVLQNSRVTKCIYANKQWEVEFGNGEKIHGEHLICAAPMQELVRDFLPHFSAAVTQAVRKLRYRDFLIVVLILKDKNKFPDNWIYIHDNTVDVARIQNFKSWSPEMVPDAANCCYGMEYFCFEGDARWTMSDEDLIKKATSEIIQLGLATAADILDGCVVRQAKAYPVYDNEYKANVNLIRSALHEKYPSLHLVGPNGMHKYNNQDYAMMTAMLAVKNIISGSFEFDIWEVNQEAEFLEVGETKIADGLPSGKASVATEE
jgi:protoporphyrinogen oxidase